MIFSRASDEGSIKNLLGGEKTRKTFNPSLERKKEKKDSFAAIPVTLLDIIVLYANKLHQTTKTADHNLARDLLATMGHSVL